MARRTKITIETGSSLVVVQDYETATGQIYQMKAGGFGEYTMAQYANVDLTNASAMIALIHSDGTTFQAVAIESIESVTINGVAATITDLELVREVVAPYFFNVGSSSFPFYKEVLLGPAELATVGSEIELLPAVAGHYYKWSMDWEFKYGTAMYSLSGNALVIKEGTAVVVGINGSAIVFGADRITHNIVPESQGSNYRVPNYVGVAVSLATSSGANATLGDGTLLIKIYYDLKRFRTA